MNDNNVFNELLEKVQSNLPEIQNLFNKYQNNFFPPRRAEFFCLELNGEAGELANAEKKIWKGKSVPKDKLEDEAADVFIALMNYVNARNIDIATAIKSKLQVIEDKRRSLHQIGEDY
ncbi:MAG: hypothetical protein ACK42Z_04400 [Candidatus Kapaibacteriota bacterium]